MKVKNKYVEIKTGNKTYKQHNMILNEYLYKLFNMQLDVVHDRCELNACYIKLDTPIDVDYESQILTTEFDFYYKNINTETYLKNILKKGKNNITNNFNFDNCSDIYAGNKYIGVSGKNQFAGRKIVGIGFGYTEQPYIYAYLDTRNMNIIINYDEEISITRIDVLQSDGICDGIDHPLHLVNDLEKKDYEWDSEQQQFYFTKAQLYSVGFGGMIGYMEEEYLIDNLTTTRTDNSISFDLTRDKRIGKYPSNNLYTGFYPLKDNSKYLIFKYRLYRISSDQSDYTYLDKYYTMSMPNETFGDLNIKLKLERI